MIAPSSVHRLRLRAALLLMTVCMLGGIAVAQDTDTAAVSITEQQAVQDSAEAWLALIDSMNYVGS